MNFREKVLKLVSEVPEGRIASYGQIAALAGQPRAARQVGWALASMGINEQKLPWWRIVNKKAYLSIRNEEIGAKLEQRSLLEDEGIEFEDEFQIANPDRYWWHPEHQLLPDLEETI